MFKSNDKMLKEESIMTHKKVSQDSRSHLDILKKEIALKIDNYEDWILFDDQDGFDVGDSYP